MVGHEREGLKDRFDDGRCCEQDNNLQERLLVACHLDGTLALAVLSFLANFFGELLRVGALVR